LRATFVSTRVTSGTTIDPGELPADVESLKEIIAAQRERIAALEHRVHVLTKLAFGPSS
jgi:hypothetical protein